MGNALMKKMLVGVLFCAASALANAPAQPETFVIHSRGHVATITIPVGAVSNFSADAAEALPGLDPKVETMHLSGDVRIQVLGERQPIQITADQVLLELTADEKHDPKGDAHAGGSAIRARSSESVEDARDAQIFLGHVSFTVQTVAGAMQIRADRVEHRLGGTGA